ncbi:MAG: M3 family oligoendopeptidase [Myxococcota bacterium]
MNAAQTDALRWDLKDLYASPEDGRVGDDLGRATALAEEFARRFRGRVPQLSPAELQEALSAYEALMEVAYRPQLYAQLLFSGQTEDEKAQALLNRARQATTEALNKTRFFDVELKKMPAADFQKLEAAPVLASYRHYLSALRRFAPFTLSEAEEKLAELKNLTGRAAFSQLYTEVASRIRIPLEVEGKTKEVNVAEARALRSSPDRALRRRATDGLMKAFEDEHHVLNYCFNTLYQDHALEVTQRGFPGVAEPTYLEDELPAEVVENLLAITERHYPLAQRYMKLKARALGLSDFSSHDVLAPLQKSEKKVPFEEGRQLVLDAFGAFDGRFRDIAGEFFDHRWIDVMPRPGKRDGAFCSGMLPSLHPYVLLNYNERIEDVSTLAHELGHGIHFYLSRRNSPLNFWPTTPMAETASVFGELLLMKRLLEGEKDKEVRKSLLAVRIEDILSTVFNQVSYVRWEQKAHARRAGGVVPAEDFSSLWMEERTRLYGDAVRFFPQDRWGWISIPHFVHYRFYCYSYAFGQLLVLALFKKYEEEGASFVPKYVELLSCGSADTPQAMLARVGVDLSDAGFWGRGFSTLEGLLGEFEALL